jgi:hypothetical protein
MKRNIFWLGILVMALVFGMTVVGCGDDEPNTPIDNNGPPPGSVDNYAHLEPPMAPNPNRAVVRNGGSAKVGIPDYLVESRSARAVTATFAVHNDDAAIAQILSQNGSTCTVKGLQLGSARIIITVGDQSATVIMAVAPSQDFYTLPATQVKQIGQGASSVAWWSSSRPDALPGDYQSYNSEPTYQLAWNWRNPNQYYGASGTPCGIDILAYFVDPSVSDRRGWVRTTFDFGGWHYDLNGVTNKMTDGVQVNGDIKLELKPEFFYDNGTPYLQIKHVLTNTGSTTLTDQKFGASADVMLYSMDRAPLTYIKEYGALMTNEHNDYYNNRILPTMKLRLICQNVPGVNNVSTIWLGKFGSERNYVYVDKRDNIAADEMDTAMNFSYQNITLNSGESKTFVLRFTQVQ